VLDIRHKDGIRNIKFDYIFFEKNYMFWRMSEGREGDEGMRG
jgi:hypothetical protein